MGKRFSKKVWVTALIAAILTAVVIGTSVVSAIAQNTSEKSRSARYSLLAADEKMNEKTLNKHLYDATHNRARWLSDLIAASGKATAKSADSAFETAKRLGIIDAYTEEDMVQPLTRLFVAQTAVRALGYPQRSLGRIVDITPSQSAMSTMAYYGYFLPDNEDKIYPNAQITEADYEMLMTELARYQRLKGKRVLAFGDSIMYGAGNNGEGIADLIATKYGMQVRDYSVPGAAVGDRGDRSRIANQIRVAYAAQEKADIILLNGGTNDMGGTPFGEFAEGFDMSDTEEMTYTGGFQKSLWLLGQYWKGVPVVYTRVHNMNLVDDKTERRYGERAMDITAKWGITSVDLYNGSGMNTEIAEVCDRYTFVDERYGKEHDSIHPNAFGYAKFYLPLIGDAVADEFAKE